MKHQGTVTLRTPRLVLRRLALSDAELMYTNWAGDPAVTEHLSWPAHVSAQATAEYLSTVIPGYAANDCYLWAIELKIPGEPIGTIGVVGMNETIGEAEIGYCIGRPWWAQGLMTEAASAVADFLFSQVEINRLVIKHASDNPASGAVAMKLGMSHEGCLRQGIRTNQGLEDAEVWSLLTSDRITV